MLSQTPALAQILGIDLGTSFSAVALMHASARPQILPVDHGLHRLPSQIFFQDTGPIVGQSAREAALQDPSRYVEKFKLRMGESVPCYIDPAGKSYRAEDLSAIVLYRLHQEACKSVAKTVTEAAIAVPAHFTQAQRQATIAAGRAAGLDVVGLVDEPTAAAFSYGLERLAPDSTVLVYDLGGGTFDVSLLRRTHDNFQILIVDGDQYLGGLDFDERLVQRYVGVIQSQLECDPLQDETLMLELRIKAEAAKRVLSRTLEVRDFVKIGDRTIAIRTTRQQFEEMTADLMERTVEVMRRTLRSAQLTWRDVDRVLLVGGSTWMPMVRMAIRSVSGKEPDLGVNPDEAVAAGAALYGWAMRGASDDAATVITAPARPPGALEIATSQAEPIRISLDGALIGTISAERPIRSRSLPPGEYLIRAECDGRAAIERRVTTEPGTERRVVIDFPAAAPETDAFARLGSEFFAGTSLSLDSPAPESPEPAPRASAQAIVFAEMMTEVPEGSFFMGASGVIDESPIREVAVPGFWISPFPVTNRDYRAFCEATGAPAPENPDGWGDYFAECPDHPVVMATWEDAQEFCRWMTRTLGAPFRLPTEAEWEYAARAGTTTPFPWGDDPPVDDFARFAGNAPATGVRTARIGKFMPNRWEIYDMHGNVWEWCADWYARTYDRADAQTPTRGPSAGAHRVCRGGSWANEPFYLRSSARMHFPPLFRAPFLGFRVVAERAPLERAG
jgi:molecular chaperone DnaK